MSIFGYPIRDKAILLPVTTKNFKEVLFEHLKEEDVQFCCRRNVLHTIFSKTFTKNWGQGYTNDGFGTWMVSESGVLKLSRLEYINYAFDLFDDFPEVETYIQTVFYDRGNSVYRRNFRDECHMYNKTYIFILGEEE